MTSTRTLSSVYRILSATTTTAAYALAFPLLLDAVVGFPRRVVFQILFATVGAACFGAVFHIVRNRTIQIVCSVGQFLLALFLAVITGPAVWLRGLLLLPILVQNGHALSLAAYTSLSLGQTALVLSGGSTVVAWSHVIGAAALRDRIILGLTAAVLIAVIAFVRFVLTRFHVQEQLVGNLKTNIVNLTQANYEFQKYAGDAEETARREERLRITRDIHDSIGYTMTNLRMMLEAGKDMIGNSPLQLEMHLEKALEIVGTGSTEVRTALHQLRHHESDRKTGVPGLQALVRLFAETTCIGVTVSWGDIPWVLPARTEAALYRFIQEGMSNALSHGNATEIRIAFRRGDADLLIAGVADNGVGADTIIEGIGLRGMRERIESLGGSVTAQSSTAGFLVEARFPLREVRE